MLDNTQFWRDVSTSPGRFTCTRVYILPDNINTLPNGQVDLTDAQDVTGSLVSIKMKDEIDAKSMSSYIGTITVKTINLEFKDRVNIDNAVILVRAGVTDVEPEYGQLPDYEMMDVGIYNITDSEYDKRKDRTIKVVGRDRLTELDKRIPVDELSTLVGDNVFDIAVDWSTKYNFELDTSNWDIAKDISVITMENKGYNTHLEFIHDIASATMRFVQIIDLGDTYKISFKSMPNENQPSYKLDYIFDIIEGLSMKPVNTLNLTSELGDNVTDTIPGILEGSVLEVKDIEIIRDNKEANITKLLDEVAGMSYEGLTVKYPGDPTIQVGDSITFLDELTNEYRTIFVTELEFSDAGAWTGRLKSVIMDIDQAASNFKGTYDQRIKNTNAYVDKVNGEIGLLVTDIDSVKQSTTENTAQISLNSQGIQQEIIERTTQGELILEQTSSLVQQTAEDFNVIFSKLEADQTLTNGEVELIQSYFRINENGVIIGKSNSAIEFFAENNRVGFRDEILGDIAYWEEGTMHVDRLIAITTIMVGYHLIEKYDSPVAGKTTIVRIGD